MLKISMLDNEFENNQFKITATSPRGQWVKLMVSNPLTYWGQGPDSIKRCRYCQYRKSHCGDKTILRPSYLHNGISYTGKTPPLYWVRALVRPLWTGSSYVLVTHLPLDKMAAISLMISSVAFSWMKSFVFWLTFVPKGPIDNKPALV